jgi:hypothetical protein
MNWSNYNDGYLLNNAVFFSIEKKQNKQTPPQADWSFQYLQSFLHENAVFIVVYGTFMQNKLDVVNGDM